MDIGEEIKQWIRSVRPFFPISDCGMTEWTSGRGTQDFGGVGKQLRKSLRAGGSCADVLSLWRTDLDHIHRPQTVILLSRASSPAEHPGTLYIILLYLIFLYSFIHSFIHSFLSFFLSFFSLSLSLSPSLSTFIC